MHDFTIRAGTLADIGSFLALAGPEFARVSPLPLDAAQMATSAARLIKMPDAEVFVADVDGEIAGFLAVVLTPTLFTAGRVAEEIICFTTAEHRRSGVARALVERALAWARERGAVAMKASAEVDLEGGGALFEGLGFKAQETAYVRRIDRAVLQ